VTPALPIAEAKVFSQNGEDGVIESIFRAIGERSRYYVEIGTGPRAEECNTRLLLQRGWSGVWIDRDGDPSAGVVKVRITPDNVNSIFKALGVPTVPQPDLVSIDVDGQDLWIWEAMRLLPRVVVIEYNAQLGPGWIASVPRDNDFVWSGDAYFGASLMGLACLAQRKGYTLVYCESRGVNAFFVRSDVWANLLYRRAERPHPQPERPGAWDTLERFANLGHPFGLK